MDKKFKFEGNYIPTPKTGFKKEEEGEVKIIKYGRDCEDYLPSVEISSLTCSYDPSIRLSYNCRHSDKCFTKKKLNRGFLQSYTEIYDIRDLLVGENDCLGINFEEEELRKLEYEGSLSTIPKTIKVEDTTPEVEAVRKEIEDLKLKSIRGFIIKELTSEENTLIKKHLPSGKVGIIYDWACGCGYSAQYRLKDGNLNDIEVREEKRNDRGFIVESKYTVNYNDCEGASVEEKIKFFKSGKFRDIFNSVKEEINKIKLSEVLEKEKD